MPSRASALYTSPSGRLTSQVTVPTVHISLPAHMTARLKPLTFTVSVFVTLTVLRWKHSMCRNPSGPHGGITLASRVFPGSQHCSVFNSFNLVRVPRRLHSPCHSHRSRTDTTPSGPALSSQPSLSSIVSHFPVGLTRDVRTQTVSLCSVPSTHHATTADASTQLPISDFLQLCFTKYPFWRTVPLRLHEDLREAQKTPSNTGNGTAVTFADAAAQLSFAEFFERCILSRAPPSPTSTPPPPPSPPAQPYSAFKIHLLRLPHTVPLSQTLPPNSRSQSSFLGASTLMTRWIDSLLSLHTGTSVAPHFHIPSTWMPLCTPVPRTQLNGAPPPARGLEVQTPLSSPHVSLSKQRPCDPVRNLFLPLPSQVRHSHPLQRRPCSHRKYQLVLHLPRKGVPVPLKREPTLPPVQ